MDAYSIEPGIVVEVAAGRVRRDGAVVPLQCREAELAVALALQERAVPAAFLSELLFPDRDPGGTNIVKVYVYRLRQRVGPGFVLYADGGYRLSDDVAVDVVQGRAAVARLTRSDGPLDACERDRLLRLARRLRADAPTPLLQCSWYEAVERVARRLGRNLALLIARNAVEHGQPRDALLIAEELTYADACDEEAWELLIRAQLLLERRAGALQSFRFYEAALAKELAVRPSPDIRRLVEEPRYAVGA